MIYNKKLKCRFKIITRGKGEYAGYTSIYKEKSFMFNIPTNELGFRLFDKLNNNVQKYLESLYPNDEIKTIWIRG